MIDILGPTRPEFRARAKDLTSNSNISYITDTGLCSDLSSYLLLSADVRAGECTVPDKRTVCRTLPDRKTVHAGKSQEYTPEG